MLVKRKQLIRAEMRARLKKPEKQSIYRKRKWVAEQVIGQIKGGLGFRGVTVRGEESARAQWLFTYAVHNVMNAVRYVSGLRKKEITPVTGWKGQKPAVYVRLESLKHRKPASNRPPYQRSHQAAPIREYSSVKLLGPSLPEIVGVRHDQDFINPVALRARIGRLTI